MVALSKSRTVAAFVAILAIAAANAQFGPVVTPSPTGASTPAPRDLPNVSATMKAAIGEMGQYDINTMTVSIPPGVTTENPVGPDGITYPPAAIAYGQWVNETLIRALIANQSIGSLFNSPTATNKRKAPPVDWWRALQSSLYDWSKDSSPLLFGLDSVHGVNYADGATLFPQQIGTAATFDPRHAFNAGQVTSRESRYLGIPWAFSPILGIAVQPSWPRVYETFGEDPFLASRMGVSIIEGLQQAPPPGMFPDLCDSASNLTNLLCPQHAVAACMKHFVGYSNARTGRDRTPAWIPDNFLLQYFVPSFKAAVQEAGVLSAMENYIEVNGRPVVTSEMYLKTLLREALTFQGMLVTDYNEIPAVFNFHNAATSLKDAVYQAINQTSIDMGMYSNPNAFAETLAENLATLFQEGRLSEDRLIESAARVIELKGKLGLTTASPVPPSQSMPTDSYATHASTPDGETCFFGCPEHHEMAYNATRDSMTLLENDGILPLDPANLPGKRIAVVGRACNSVPYMAGGWTVHWQGSHDPADFPYGTTVLDELRGRYGSANVVYSPGCSLEEGSSCTDEELANATTAATMSLATIVCVGEAPYAEIFGDIYNLTVPGGQIPMVEAIKKVTPNIITVLVEGRPRVLGSIPGNSRAVLHAYLPGPFGGRAIVETLLGIHRPNGRLPVTYPKYLSDGPLQYWRRYSADQFGDFEPQWEFGRGMAYEKFMYSSITAALVELSDIRVNVTVTNWGPQTASHTVPLFITQTGRPMPAEVKLLMDVIKVHDLAPGASAVIDFKVDLFSLGYYNEVGCKCLAIRPTFATVGTDKPATSPPTGNTVHVDLGLAPHGPDDVIDLNECPLEPYFRARMVKSAFSPSGAPPSAGLGESEDYFMSSVVCFVGGVIATCLLVFFVRRKNRARSDSASSVQLFEPSGV
jgi:beta-glucosidase